jgi:hypothetical protein
MNTNNQGALNSQFDPNLALDSKSKGRKKGVPNYNIEILLNVLDTILPAAQFDWIKVAASYMKSSGEGHLRDGADIRRFFNKVHSATKKPNQVHFSTAVLDRARAIGMRMQAKVEATADTARDHHHAELTYERLMMDNDEEDRSVLSNESVSDESRDGNCSGKKRKAYPGSPKSGPAVALNDVVYSSLTMLMER